MTLSIDKLTIRGFKSIRELDGLELKNLNILVGANGSGKSNFIALLKLLKAKAEGNLKSYINLNSGLKELLFKGRNSEKAMQVEIRLDKVVYKLTIVAGVGESYNVIESMLDKSQPLVKNEQGTVNAIDETLAVSEEEGHYSSNDDYKEIYDKIKSWKIYHFHETGDLASMRNSEIVQDHMYLRHDASNIAPFLCT